MVPYDDLYQITRDSIERSTLASGGGKACGCWKRPDGGNEWWLCPYHEGMEVGIEQALLSVLNKAND